MIALAEYCSAGPNFKKNSIVARHRSKQKLDILGGDLHQLFSYYRPGQNPANMAISPITGELVPLSEMAEHMRISLIDPQWKTQREAMLSKIRETTQASDDEISRNLVDLAGHRPDVFGELDRPTCPDGISPD